MNSFGEVYKRINNKFESGEFTKGEDYSFHYLYGGSIEDYSIEERTPNVCSSLMNYGKCSIEDVPKESLTREFFINSFYDKGVKEYLKNHLKDFDRQFWLDMIVSNRYCTHFDNNIFDIMPIEFIDDEMCSLAMIKTLDWVAFDWFYSIFKRKPNAISSNVWKLASRVYKNNAKFFIENIPVEFKDEEFYLEFLSCSFNNGFSLKNEKSSSMDLIPKEMINDKFLIKLVNYDKTQWHNEYANLGAFNEEALETKINYNQETLPFWKYMLLINPETIRHIPLNLERIDFFLSRNDKNSFAYNCYFKDKYEKFLKESED